MGIAPPAPPPPPAPPAPLPPSPVPMKTTTMTTMPAPAMIESRNAEWNDREILFGIGLALAYLPGQ